MGLGAMIQDDDPAADTGQSVQSRHEPALKRNFPGLGRIAGSIKQFEDVLRDFVTMSDGDSSKKVTRILQQVREVEPSVTVIGQIKAGKTSLINAMIGEPGLLPTDVNPWTSVVTSLHINTPSPELNVRAKFKFFDSAEWDKLVSNGGRIGLCFVGLKAQRRAISTVDSSASGRSANAAIISAGDLRYCCGEARGRSAWLT